MDATDNTDWKSGCLWTVAAVTACGFAVGVALLWDGILGPQAERMEPWKQVAIWTGEIVAAAWALQFIVRHSFGMELTDQELPSPQRLRLPFATIMLGLFADACVTGIVIFDEYHGFQHAHAVKGTVTEVRRDKSERYDIYRLCVSFNGPENVQHQSTIRVTEFKREGFPAGTPHQQEIRNLRRGFDMGITSDPRFPKRTWGEWESWFDGIVKTHLIMLMLLAAQIGGLIWFAYELKQRIAAGVMPWWHELYKIGPIAGEAMLLVFGGAILSFVRLIG